MILKKIWGATAPLANKQLCPWMREPQNLYLVPSHNCGTIFFFFWLRSVNFSYLTNSRHKKEANKDRTEINGCA